MYGPPNAAGWLPRYLGPHPSLAGVKIGRHYPTRWEEYAFAIEAIDHQTPGLALDAGTGFNPDIHNLPYMLVNLGWRVWAIDSNPETLKMPAHESILRGVADMTSLPIVNPEFDAWVSISTLEHLAEADQEKSLAEAYRILKPGGLLAATADWLDPVEFAAMAADVGFPEAAIIPFHGERLDPNVSFLRVRKV